MGGGGGGEGQGKLLFVSFFQSFFYFCQSRKAGFHFPPPPPPGPSASINFASTLVFNFLRGFSCTQVPRAHLSLNFLLQLLFNFFLEQSWKKLSLVSSTFRISWNELFSTSFLLFTFYLFSDSPACACPAPVTTVGLGEKLSSPPSPPLARSRARSSVDAPGKVAAQEWLQQRQEVCIGTFIAMASGLMRHLGYAG